MLIPSNPDFNDVVTLLSDATSAMILRLPVMVSHPPHWKRPDGWPLPIERVKPASDAEGFEQAYRAMAVIEWCEFKLGEPERAEKAAGLVAWRAARGEQE